MTVLRQLGGLIVVALFTMGPVLAIMLLLNLRDRRQAALLERTWQLTPKDLSDQIAIQVRCGLISRRSVVIVNMHSCSRNEIWEALARWSASLPPQVRLLVNGKVDHGLSASFTLETTCRPPLRCSPRPATMTR